jgi:hypothetical protein
MCTTIRHELHHARKALPGTIFDAKKLSTDPKRSGFLKQNLLRYSVHELVCTMWRRESSVQSVYNVEKKGFPLLRLLFYKNIVEEENI